ncbi:hypothetical protein JK358_10575 [Nocardia sp. 2]|uniref:Secreted protein n=1 Tax=Nocardia acididurans TaxID=2802282 RepID=A0ABS1M2T9_9NOCA|nr:hypothetical protein [Nocardia acididurans]MBL1074836.1 hypothetical protein [Nocardia acididurans]
MKTLVGTTGAFAIALCLFAAPSAAEGITLQPAADIQSGSAPSVGAGSATGGGDVETGLGLGSVQVGSSVKDGPYLDFGSVRVGNSGSGLK